MLNYIEKKWCEKLDDLFDEKPRSGFIPVNSFANDYYCELEVYEQ